MAEHSNDTVMDDFEAIMTPKARLSKGMVGRVQASTMAMLQAGEGMAYVKATLNRSEKEEGNVISRPRTIGPIVCEGQSIIWIKVPFGQGDDEPGEGEHANSVVGGTKHAAKGHHLW